MAIELNNFTIIVNEASIKNNFMPNGEFKMNPTMQRKIGKINDSDDNYFVETSVEIHNTPENPFPIELIASIKGIFNIKGDDTEKIDEFLKVQGFQMVFPHLRALVANMTANCMMPIILLPIVYANQFIDK